MIGRDSIVAVRGVVAASTQVRFQLTAFVFSIFGISGVYVGIVVVGLSTRIDSLVAIESKSLIKVCI